MSKGNILVIGNSGVGKSTLINSVLGEDVAKTGWGTTGTTNKLEIYESKNGNVPFRIIDTIGFEPSFFKEHKAINAVQKWSKQAAKNGNEDNQIDVIWFCVEGTKRKLFPEDIKSLSKATSIWETVPVIVVITKSYSVPEREENVKLVHQAFASQKKYANNLKNVIPVVAQVYQLNETAYAAPEGIDQLIDETNNLLPEGRQAAKNDIAKFILNRKRALSQSVVITATAGAAVVGAVPIPFSDALILSPVEVGEVNVISKIYGIKNNEESKRFLNSIVEVGTVGTAAKTLINMLKAIPGIKLGASIINAIIAGTIVAALGEGSIYAFEQIYLGNKTIADVDWVTKIIESKLAGTLVDTIKPYMEKLTDTSSKSEIMQVIKDIASVILKNESYEKKSI